MKINTIIFALLSQHSINHTNMQKQDINQYSSSALSFVGDAVFSLYVRIYLTQKYDYKSGELHKISVQIVSAVAQSNFVDTILEHLTENELAVYKRCKNAHQNNKPKSVTYEQYKKASGLEGLLGYLYLDNQLDRLQQIIDWQLSTFD